MVFIVNCIIINNNNNKARERIYMLDKPTRTTFLPKRAAQQWEKLDNWQTSNKNKCTHFMHIPKNLH